MSDYLLGQSIHEQERLMMRARIIRPYMEPFFRQAALNHGMRVLDVGSGVGDVALLAADIVGSRGRVFGLDRDDVSLEHAHRCVIEQGCSSWVSFQTTPLDSFETDQQFDAIVGRYVMLYQPDPAATLRHLTRFLQPGGIVVFHEVDFTCPVLTSPKCDFVDQVLWLVSKVFRRANISPDFGRYLPQLFLDSNLPWPHLAAEIPVGCGPGSPLCPWIASTVQTIAPRLSSLGIEIPQGVMIDDTLASKLEAACVEARSLLTASIQYGAWARKPASLNAA